MESKPVIHSRFSITSGSICYGALNNIWHGASQPTAQGLPAPLAEPSGTVIVHPLEHRVPAVNGTWLSYQLVDLGSDRYDIEPGAVVAWFVAHEDVEPAAELARVIKVSGSPYEFDGGPSRNTKETSEQGVFVINRYDWGWYDQRGQKEMDKAFEEKIEADRGDQSEGDDEKGEEAEYSGVCNNIGLVDFTTAKSQVLDWKPLDDSERGTTPSGIWLYTPHAEYMFGRFGFTEDLSAARSFIFFTTQTIFTRTTFSGLEKTLLPDETHEQRFQRYLAEGEQFDGLATIKRMQRFGRPFGEPIIPDPPEAEYIGPFEKTEHVLGPEEFEALRHGANAVEFCEPLKEIDFDLLNELVTSYLHHFIVPIALPSSDTTTTAQAAEKLFPGRTEGISLANYLYDYMLKPQVKPKPNFNAKLVAEKVGAFLVSKCGDSPLAKDVEFAAGVTRGVAYMVEEILELASNGSRDSWRGKITPSDVRVAVMNDQELLWCFKYSRTFWKGRE